jgi:hypothetical protein
VLLPYVSDAAWLDYGETPEDVLDTPKLLANKQLIRDLTGLCPQLSFKKQTMKAALFEVAKSKAFVELSDSAVLLEWVDVMAARLRLACRHVAHSRVRPNPPAWLQEIDGPEQSRMSSQGGGHGEEEVSLQGAGEAHGHGHGAEGAEGAEGHDHGGGAGAAHGRDGGQAASSAGDGEAGQDPTC